LNTAIFPAEEAFYADTGSLMPLSREKSRLGVHFKRALDDGAFIGPNAVLAMALAGYSWRTFNAHDVIATWAWPGTRRMAWKNWRIGIEEVADSLSRQRFARRAQRYVPGLNVDDLVASPAGVRS
jgi:L-2-hydroxyglutarate oxidase LhgO